MRIALYQPEIAGNVGTILRLAACFGVAVHIIEPCGFPFADRALRRAGMDYAADAVITRHSDWGSFEQQRPGRLMLMTTKAGISLYEASFAPDDTLLFGSESAGVPDHVHAAANLALR